MKFYDLDTEFTFGKLRGKTLREILDLQPSYIDWCAVYLDHFYISENVIEELKTIKPDFSLKEEIQLKLNEKYTIWKNEQDYNKRNDYYHFRDDDDEGPLSYEDWLNEEFGDDAETAYWNMD